jgi:serpin B
LAVARTPSTSRLSKSSSGSRARNSFQIKKLESAPTDLIKDILTPASVHGGTPAVLTNALYFKGAWLRKFDSFYLLTGDHIRVPFMSSTSKQDIASHTGCKVLRLPYASVREHWAFSMYVYLPDADDLSGLLQKLSSDPKEEEENEEKLPVLKGKRW